MIKLKVEIKRKKINFSKKSNDLILFFANHLEDKQRILKLFIILDCFNSELIYINSYILSNINILLNIGLKTRKYVIGDPHSVVNFGFKDIFIFSEEVISDFPFFYRLNIKEKSLFLYTLNDFNLDLGTYGTISSTNFKVKEKYIILQVTHKNKKGIILESIIKFNYKKLTSEIIFEKKSSNQHKFINPHSIIMYKDFIYTSNFEDRYVKCPLIGGKIYNWDKYYRILSKYYNIYLKIFNRIKNNKRNLNLFNAEILFDNYFGSITKSYNYERNFKHSFLTSKEKKSFISFCNKTDFKFKGVKGDINIINYKTKEICKIKTSFMSPGHFEVCKISNHVYISSHNFVKFGGGNYYFLGPAAIDKYRIKEGQLYFKGSFINKTGFRFTSHKIFNFLGEPFICTIGFPNRLFIIKALDMSLYYYFDLGDNLLSTTNHFMYYINSGIQREKSLLGIEVLQKGKFLIFLGNKDILIFNFKERKINNKIPYIFNFTFKSGINLCDFERSVTHLCKLDL